MEAASARRGLVRYSPLSDLRLVRFALGLPSEQRWRGLYSKIVIRRALYDRLPAEILERTDKADFSHVLLPDIAQRQASMGTLVSLTARGVIVQAEALRTLERLWLAVRAGDPRTYTMVWTSWTLLALEEWSRWADRAVRGGPPILGMTG
jgi:hypothetical protein